MPPRERATAQQHGSGRPRQHRQQLPTVPTANCRQYPFAQRTACSYQNTIAGTCIAALAFLNRAAMHLPIIRASRSPSLSLRRTYNLSGRTAIHPYRTPYRTINPRFVLLVYTPYPHARTTLPSARRKQSKRETGLDYKIKKNRIYKK